MEVKMKRGLIIVLLLVAMDMWGQSAWSYNREWGGVTGYEGSGRAIFDYWADLNNNRPHGLFKKIEHPSNEQMNIIKYGLGQYTLRINDVYIILK
jgi:hypothetical protein